MTGELLSALWVGSGALACLRAALLPVLAGQLLCQLTTRHVPTHAHSPPLGSPFLLLRRIKEAQRLAKLRRTTSQREAAYLEAEQQAALKQQQVAVVPGEVPPPAALVTVV